jgi:hypothetical protein
VNSSTEVIEDIILGYKTEIEEVGVEHVIFLGAYEAEWV